MLDVHSQVLIEESKRFKIESEMKARYEGILAQKLKELRKEGEQHHATKVWRLKRYTIAHMYGYEIIHE